MKFGQLIEYKNRNAFLQKSCRKWDRETGSRPLFIFSAAWFQYNLIALNFTYNKSKPYKSLDYWSRDMVNYDFLEKSLGIGFLTHFLHDFSRKIFLILFSINWLNFIEWLPLLLEILDIMWITIFCFPGCDVINLESDLILLIKPFFYMTRKSGQKFRYLENKMSF